MVDLLGKSALTPSIHDIDSFIPCLFFDAVDDPGEDHILVSITGIFTSNLYTDGINVQLTLHCKPT